MSERHLWRRVFPFLAIIIASGCSRPPESPDERDWQKLLPKVTGYESEHERYVRPHLTTYPNCRHRSIAEEFYVERCRKHYDSCDEYFELFPSGEYRDELEAVYANHCKSKSEMCIKYFKLFPSGRHENELEAVYARRCIGDAKSCAEYFDLFSSGQHKNELEPVVWKACEESGNPSLVLPCEDCCDIYEVNFSRGGHIAEVLSIADRKKRELQAAREAEASQARLEMARRAVAWQNTLTDLSIEYPPGVERSLVSFAALGRAIYPRGSGAEMLSVPLGYPVEVCYAGKSPVLYSTGSHENRCATVEPQGSSLRVPLTKVYVSYPKFMDRTCQLAFGQEQEEFWAMPGSYAWTCQFSRDFAGHAFEYTKDDLTVRFDAPIAGGTVHLVISQVSNAIHGKAIVSKQWMPRQLPVEIPAI